MRNYRATPHSTTGQSPARLLFGRNIRVCLPQITESAKDDKLRATDLNAKEKMKVYADRNARDTKVSIGDTELVRQKYTNKHSTPFKPTPYQVVAKKGSMITADNGNHRPTTKQLILQTCEH